MRQMSARPHSRRQPEEQRESTAEAVLAVTANHRLVAKSGRRKAFIKEREKIKDCLWPLPARTAHELVYDI